MNKKIDTPEGSDAVPEGLLGLITGGKKFLVTLRMYFFEASTLGQRCRDLEFTGISNPWSFGVRCTALIALAAWFLGERNPGTFKDTLLQFVAEPSSILYILGFLVLLQLLFTRSFSGRALLSQISVVVYAIGAFSLPFIAIVLALELSHALPDSLPFALVLVLAPFAGYAFLLVPSRMLGEILRCEESYVFGAFLAYGVAATKGVEYLQRAI